MIYYSLALFFLIYNLINILLKKNLSLTELKINSQKKSTVLVKI